MCHRWWQRGDDRVQQITRRRFCTLVLSSLPAWENIFSFVGHELDGNDVEIFAVVQHFTRDSLCSWSYHGLSLGRAILLTVVS